MKDKFYQGDAFETSIHTTINAAYIRNISFRPPLAGMDLEVSTKFYKENLIYRFSFPRQIGKSKVIHSFWSKQGIDSFYSVFSSYTYKLEHYETFIELQLGKRVFVIEGFNAEELETLINKTVQKSVETGFYSPIIIID